jgi:hypothetical protein
MNAFAVNRSDAPNLQTLDHHEEHEAHEESYGRLGSKTSCSLCSSWFKKVFEVLKNQIHNLLIEWAGRRAMQLSPSNMFLPRSTRRTRRQIIRRSSILRALCVLRGLKMSSVQKALCGSNYWNYKVGQISRPKNFHSMRPREPTSARRRRQKH